MFRPGVVGWHPPYDSLMMTARGSAQEQRLALSHGADGFISKPFDLGALRAEMRRILAL